MEKQVQVENVTWSVYAEYFPRPFASALTDGCIEPGQDLRSWAYPGRVESFAIAVDPTNAAVKKFVFDEKKIPMAELIKIIDRNCEGREGLRQMMLSAPKFGNDDDYVDMIANEVHYRMEGGMEKHLQMARYHLSAADVRGPTAVLKSCSKVDTL